MIEVITVLFVGSW